MKRRETTGSRVISAGRLLRPGLRLAAVVAAAAVFAALPADWRAAGRMVTLLAAGIRQPENAAQLLCSRLDGTQPPVPETAGGQTANAPAADSDSIPAAEANRSQPDALPAAAAAEPPAEDGSGGKIYERRLSSGDTTFLGIAVKNQSGTSPDFSAALSAPLSQRWAQTDEPQVLIIHTHTTEEYMLYDAGYYNAGDRSRTTDGSRTVCAVGDAVVEALAQAGIAAVHDTTVHDSPKYSGAYTRSAETVQKNLEKYPSIRVVLDLHRDAILQGDSDLVKPTVTIGGRKAAQVMILAGVVDTAALPHPNWAQNLALAAQWQKALTDAYPDLMRPLSTVASRYNQHLCPGYLLVEVGSEGNTVDEAVYSGHLLGKTLAELLR